MLEYEGDPQWQALKAEIEQIITLAPTSLVLADQSLTWYRVANPEVLLEVAVADEETPAVQIDPFWAVTWRAAQGLDQFLGQRIFQAKKSDIAPRILELGCGSGQAGTGAALRGAKVTMTDAVELALKVAKLNAWMVRDRICFRTLRWTIDRCTEEPYPYIIGSDIVYDTSLFGFLEPCGREYLAPGGRMFLSEPHRHTGDTFSTWIREAGWRTVEHDWDMRDGRVPIRIFECWLA